MKKHIPFSSHKFNKKKLIIVSILAFIGLAMAAYTVFSAITWSSIDEQNKFLHRAMSNIEKTMLSDADTSEARASKIKNLQTQSKTLRKDTHAICELPVIMAWQSKLPLFEVDKRLEDCKKQQSVLMHNIDKTDTVMQYFANDESISGILKDGFAQNPTKLSEDKWNESSKKWTDMVDKLNKLDVHPGFSETKSRMVNSVTLVANSWQALIKANDSKNKAEFLKARNELIDNYNKLKTTNLGFETVLRSL